MKISLILPLVDRRDAEWKSLGSALRQAFDRSQYEVIVVVPHAVREHMADDAATQALLRECDAIVPVDGDPLRPDQEIPFLLAGYERSTGDVLLFMEGHTVLDPQCCANIAAHFRDCPRSQIAWAPRIHAHESPLGGLIGMHSKHHEGRAGDRGGFWVGANSVIARSLFERLGRLDAGYMRFAERVLLERVLRENIAIGKIEATLATHHDDVPAAQLIAIAAAAGAGKFRYYAAPLAGTGTVQIRHWIYACANLAPVAFLLLPLSRVLGATLLRVAIAWYGISRALAYRVFVLGLGFADLAGFCRARLRGKSPPHRGKDAVVPSAGGDGTPALTGIARARRVP